MSLRKSLTNELLDALIISKESTNFTIDLLESQLLAGGNAKEVVLASEILDRNQIQYDLYTLLAFDLARENKVLQLVESFIKVHNKFPNINLKEFIKRYINGEDVICLVQQDKFIP